jgi:hypothetical protein
MPNLFAIVVDVLRAGPTVGMPFRAVEGMAGRGPCLPYVVAVTEATLLADNAARTRFWNGVWTVERALASQPGLVGYALQRQILGDKVWTMTVWNTEDDLRVLRQIGPPSPQCTRWLRRACVDALCPFHAQCRGRHSKMAPRHGSAGAH